MERKESEEETVNGGEGQVGGEFKKGSVMTEGQSEITV